MSELNSEKSSEREISALLIPFIRDLRFDPFEDSITKFIKANVKGGQIDCMLDLDGTSNWDFVTFKYEWRVYQKNGGPERGLEERYILFFHDRDRHERDYTNALEYLRHHWIRNVSKIRVMKSTNVELNASNLPEAYLKIPVSQKVMLELNDKPLTDENRNKLNKMIVDFLYACTPKDDIDMWIMNQTEVYKK